MSKVSPIRPLDSKKGGLVHGEEERKFNTETDRPLSAER